MFHIGCSGNSIRVIRYRTSVVVKDLRLNDEDKDKDLKNGPWKSSRARTFLDDNKTV